MDFPSRDDFVVVKINQILDYGVFVELLEYKNARGFIHISNVSSSWVKNIRNFVKMNQVRVAKVLNVDLEKRQIDLAFSGVNPMRERQVLNQFKQINREEKLIEILSRITKKSFDEVWSSVADPLSQIHGSLYEAFEKIALGYDFSSEVEKFWIEPVKQLVKENIVVSKKEISGKAKISCLSSGGLELIKSILKDFEETKNCIVSYAGGGSFNLSCSGLTYKEADKTLTSLVESAQKNSKKIGVVFEFIRDDKK
ncbi:MAG: S1 RNA-binding domain-containing protein [Candidatus ainarchaeum sp.]|jgi:translation initiation factor 2 subunit 1|nr:S1 RNA-binding domain-containing protein [Candidatus ainarchaeum sp.]MDD3085993.1 S1 RNA-binding domain-containing protein [Candidatus ainarchaeum sp.]MDD4128648.1 S1 RNA-binding domain-containing protein [Candidatus ainarchaeum sp.]